MDDDLSEAEAVRYLGPERFARLTRLGYLAPQGHRQGMPTYSRSYVVFRALEDQQLRQRQPAVIAKGYPRTAAPLARDSAGVVRELVVRRQLPPPAAPRRQPPGQQPTAPAGLVEEFHKLRAAYQAVCAAAG
jgi:hypothetical protein